VKIKIAKYIIAKFLNSMSRILILLFVFRLKLISDYLILFSNCKSSIMFKVN